MVGKSIPRLEPFHARFCLVRRCFAFTDKTKTQCPPPIKAPTLEKQLKFQQKLYFGANPFDNPRKSSLGTWVIQRPSISGEFQKLD